MEIQEWVYDPVSKLTCDVVTSDNCRHRDVLIVIVHGGAWMLGSKRTFRGMARHVCHEFGGVTCIVPDYSLSRIDMSCVLQSKLLIALLCFEIVCLLLSRSKQHRHGAMYLLLFLILCLVFVAIVAEMTCNNCANFSNAHPRHVQDVARCIQFACTSIMPPQKPVKLILLGHSAGAHICSLLSLNPSYLPPVLFGSIVGTIVISGIYSFWEMQRSATRHLLNRNIFVGMFDEQWTPEKLATLASQDPQKWDYIVSAWPLFHVTAQARKVPFLVLTSDTDFFILQHSLVFVKTLQHCGFITKHIHFKNTTHFSIHKHWNAKHNHIFQSIHAFLVQVCE